MRSVALIHVQQSLKAFHHKARTDQKHECERHFGNDQRPSQTVPCATHGRTAAAFFQRLVNAGVRRGQRWNDPAQEGGNHHQPKRKGHDLPIKTDGTHAGQRFRKKADTCAECNPSQGESHEATTQAEQEDLDQRLTQNRCPACSQREADGDFAAAADHPQQE